MQAVLSFFAAIAGFLFSMAALLVVISLPIVIILGPMAITTLLFAHDITTPLVAASGTTFVLAAQYHAFELFVLKPLRKTSRPCSTYAQKRLIAVALTYSQVVLHLLCAGPLRLVFVGADPFRLIEAIQRKIRNIDAQVLDVRPPIYTVDRNGRSLAIPLRDGVETAATLFSPQTKDGRHDNSPRPVVLIRTPYNRASLARWGVRFAERGYHLVTQDTRGRFGSTGDFFPMLNEAADGAATIEWLEKQPWCNGRVGTTGVSYLGLASLAAMRESLPALKAVAPVLAATDLYNVMFGRESGAAHVELMFRWSHLVMYLMNKPFGMFESIFTFFMGTGRALRRAYKHAPLNEADVKYLCPGSEPLDWFRDGFDNPLGTEPFWEGKRKFVDFSQMDSVPPVLLFGGWYDFFCSEQLHDFQALCRLSDECRIVVGPYTHWHALSMDPKLFRSLFDFFDLHLLEDPAAKSLASVDVFSMGDNMGWRQIDSWPPPKCLTKIFAFTQENGENGLAAKAQGEAMDADDPVLEEGEVSYIYDPAEPTPQIGGATFDPSNCGRLAQNQIEGRDDVLVFTSRPLEEPFTIAGEIKVRLAVVSSVEGTDYVARACQVTPDGESQNIADGIVRRFDLKPGRRTKIDITMSPVMNRLGVGDRLRIHICSSAYPKYGRHLNTRGSFHLEIEENALLSEQILFLGGKEGSDIRVPILP